MAINSIDIKEYEDSDKERWDSFVMRQSANGTFLQTRNFLDYHPAGRFDDNSLLFLNGTDIAAVIPAHAVTENGRKLLVSHRGSTFGGIVVGSRACRITYIEAIMEALGAYLEARGFGGVSLKQTGGIYQNEDADMLDYFLFLNGYDCDQEIGFFIDYSELPEDIISAYSYGRRRDYRYSLKNGLTFRELGTPDEIGQFYRVLCDNYKKFQKTPVHTLDELLDFRFSRLRDNVYFYGVFLGDEMIAGSMVFGFGKAVFHTQYLAMLLDRTDLYASEFLYTNLIRTGREMGFGKLSFGTSTFEGGRVLNRSLALFKEGFGAKAYVNRTYHKELI